jgi:hypothetical protein
LCSRIAEFGELGLLSTINMMVGESPLIARSHGSPRPTLRERRGCLDVWSESIVLEPSVRALFTRPSRQIACECCEISFTDALRVNAASSEAAPMPPIRAVVSRPSPCALRTPRSACCFSARGGRCLDQFAPGIYAGLGQPLGYRDRVCARSGGVKHPRHRRAVRTGIFTPLVNPRTSTS